MDTIDSDDKTEYDRAIQMLIVLWNHATIQEVSKDWNETEKILKPIMPDAESESVVKYMLYRKRVMFPDNKRIILNYELTETPDGLHLSVASSIP